MSKSRFFFNCSRFELLVDDIRFGSHFTSAQTKIIRMSLNLIDCQLNHKQIQFEKNSNSFDRCAFNRRVRGNQWENRAFEWNFLLRSIDYPRIPHATRSAIHDCQLLHLRLGRRIILFAVSDYVRPKQEETLTSDVQRSFHFIFIFLLFCKRVPFCWKTPFGYLVAWFFQFTACAAIILTVIPFFSFIFGSSWLFIFIADDIRKDLIDFNCSKITHQQRAKVMKHFCAIVRLCLDAKQ